MNPLHARVANLNFSTPCGTAYSATTLAALPPGPDLLQLTADKAALTTLNTKFEQHDRQFWGANADDQSGQRVAGKFEQLGSLAHSMGSNLVWTVSRFFSFPQAKIPDCLVIGSEQEAQEAQEAHQNGQQKAQEDADHQNGDQGCCSNPFEDDDFSLPHRSLSAATRKVRAAITPAKNAWDSFDDYYRGKNWGARWREFGGQYGGTPTMEGEFSECAHEIRSNWNSIRFGRNWLACQGPWLPGWKDFSSPLPWAKAYTTGWEGFKSCCSEIWHSPFLKPALPSWSCAFFENLRVELAESFRCPPFFKECSRPDLTLGCQSGHGNNPIYNTSLHRFFNGIKSVGKGILYMVSIVIWPVKFLVKNIVCNILIGAGWLLYDGGVGVLWAVTWPLQVITLGGKIIWEASKFLALYPLSKFLGLTVTVLGYGLGAVLYGVAATLAWTCKAAFQCVRFIIQNLAIGLWDGVGRPVAWLLALGAVTVKAVATFSATAFKAFLHGAYTLVAQICSYVGGRLYFHLVRPAAEYSAKALLAFAQVFVHLGIVGGQIGYAIGKLLWHFVIYPIYKAVAWTAGKFGQMVKFIWNKIALPGLYYLIWYPIRFVAEKILLFIAAVVQVPAYAVFLTLGGIGIGLWFSVSELSLFLQSHWISKAMYPLPISAYYRGLEARYTGEHRYQSVGSDPVIA